MFTVLKLQKSIGANLVKVSNYRNKHEKRKIES